MTTSGWQFSAALGEASSAPYAASAQRPGVVLYVDGLVYGRAAGLSGAQIAESLLADYQGDPAAFFRRIDGQCTVTLVEPEKNRITAFRSLLASVQIYYSAQAVSNRLAPVYRAAGKPARSAAYLADLLSDQPGLRYDRPRTPFEGIHRLAPGHAVTLTRERAPQVTSIQNLPEYRFQSKPGQRVEEVVPEVLRLLDQAIDSRLGAGESPIACELSGGLDSSFIASLLGRRKRPVTAFMYSYPKAPSHQFSEDCAREVATAYGLDFKVLAPKDLGHTDLSERQPYRDEPTDFFWQGAIFAPATNQILAPNSILFGGFGADQLFLQDPAVMPWLLSRGRIGEYRRTLADTARSLERSRAHLAWQSALMLLPQPWYQRASGLFRNWRFNPLAIEEMEADVSFSEPVEWLQLPKLDDKTAPARPSVREGRVRLEFSYLAVPSVNTDPYYEPRGIRSAHPFCDRRLIDFMLKEVSWELVHDWRNPYKHLLREAQKGIVPERVRTRPKNEFFFNGFLSQLLRDNQDYVRELLRAADVPAGIGLQRDQMSQAFDQLIFGVSSESVDKLMKMMGYLFWWRDFQAHTAG